MIVDTLLQLFGENPVGYGEAQDKWIAIIVILVENDHLFMPWILGAIPIIWLLVRRRRGKRISTIMIITTSAAAVTLGALGFFLLDWLMEVWFGLSYQRMYGDLFQ